MRVDKSSFITAWICCTIWNIFAVAGTAWLVGWNNWSPWWFIMPLLFFQQVMVEKYMVDQDDKTTQK